MRIRDYEPGDYSAVKAIHDATEIDYSFPDINSPLFLVKKAIEDDSGTIRVCGAAYMQCEVYLWMDPSDWADAADKLAAIDALDGAVLHECYLRGIDEVVFYLPPNMDRFGDRMVEIGWRKNRDGWYCYHKRLDA
jgi:hypothetical protein